MLHVGMCYREIVPTSLGVILDRQQYRDVFYYGLLLVQVLCYSSPISSLLGMYVCIYMYVCICMYKYVY